jgi:CheY-like chemotaxis protein
LARKILLADDSVTAQNMGRKILGDAGYDVVTVNNGSAALKRVSEQKPDLIVLDVYMPGYSGLEVCQRLKDSPETSDIPILLTVGKLEPFKPEEARRVRAEAFIVKPFEASELLSALTRLEDQVVPGHGKNGHGDSETGWKNRIRFPSKKKKEEPAELEQEIDYTAGTTNARSSKRGRGAAQETERAAAKAVPDIPRDITPEELDALSALAAKLDGKEATPAETVAASEPQSEPKKEFEVAAPVVEEKAPEVPAAQPQAPAPSVEEAKPAEIPVEQRAPTIATPAIAEAKAVEAAPVNVAELSEKNAAPVDRNDEPSFAAAAAEPEAKRVEVKESQPAPAPVEASAQAEPTKPGEVEAKSEGRRDENKVEEAPAKPAAAEKIAEPAKAETAAPAAAQPHDEVASPSEEELAEALRALTPATVEATTAATPAKTAAHAAAAGAGASWTAVAVIVDPEEAARSLEAEMFKTLAAPAAVGAATALTATMGSAGPRVAHAGTVEPPSPASSAQMDSVTKGSKEECAATADEPAPVTFADAVRPEKDEEVSATASAEAVSRDTAEAGLPVAETTTVSTSNASEGEADMAKESGKNGKLNGHQTTAPAHVETAQQAEDAPKAMAAAADRAHSGTADPSAIANIVDSVLADLRPKIVEEIAKKLAGK